MKNGTGTQKRSSLFLIELMISIFFFSIASAVCIQLFARAKLVGDESEASNQAYLQAQSAASAFYAGDGTLELIPGVYPNAVSVPSEAEGGADAERNASDAGQERYLIPFDENWNPCGQKDGAVYQMTITALASEQDPDALRDAEIFVESLENHEILYELSLRYHAPAHVRLKGDGAS